MAKALRDAYEAQMETYAPHKALDEIFKVIQRANKYIDECAPWVLAKDMEANGARLAHVLYNLLETIRICGGLLQPFMPDTSAEILRRIGASENADWDSLCKFGLLPREAAVTVGAPLFPRIDAQKELAELEALQKRIHDRIKAILGIEIRVSLVEPKSIERFTGKAQRVVHLRNPPYPGNENLFGQGLIPFPYTSKG